MSRCVLGPLSHLVKAGELSKSDVEAWFDGLKQADRAGHFFCAVLGFIVSGRKP